MHIGLVDLSDPVWGAGGSFSRMLLHSLLALEDGQLEVSMLGGAGEVGVGAGRVRRIPAVPRRMLPGENSLRQLLQRPESQPVLQAAERAGVEVVLPLMYLHRKPACLAIGWIPDFQHLHLPQYFSAEDRRRRERGYRRLAELSDRVLLSSRAAQNDFDGAYPDLAAKALVAPFPSLFAFEPPGESPDVCRKYHLPAKFAVVANQFWQHKNHAVVIDAIALLARSGVEVPLVFTGLPVDNRDRANTATSEILQRVAAAGLSAQCRVLGMVSRAELTGLLRRAAVVIQPSRFEGWNTTVEDAKALGRPLLCSRLPVHEEQAPRALDFFGCDAPEELADLLRRHWADLPAGPDASAEAAGLAAERVMARQHGAALREGCA